MTLKTYSAKKSDVFVETIAQILTILCNRFKI